MADNVKKMQLEEALGLLHLALKVMEYSFLPLAEPGWRLWKSLVRLKGQLSLLISAAYCFGGACIWQVAFIEVGFIGTSRWNRKLTKGPMPVFKCRKVKGQELC